MDLKDGIAKALTISGFEKLQEIRQPYFRDLK